MTSVAETGVMWSQLKDCLPAATRSWERQGENSSLEPKGKCSAVDSLDFCLLTLTSSFWLPEP